MSDAFDAKFDSGIAVGELDIRNDAMHFRFRDEQFTFPAARVHGVSFYNGYFYEAPIDKLRELEREAATG